MPRIWSDRRWLLCLLLPWALAGCELALPPAPYVSPHDISASYQDPKTQELALAAETGDAAAVKRLMKDEGVNPDIHFSPDGMPLVAWPIYTKNPAGLKAMLENGAEPNAAKAYPIGPGRTPRNDDNAMVWAAKMDDPIYLKLLLDHGGDPNTRNANRETLLFQARIWGDQWQNVQLLVQRGADINLLTRNSPIIWNYSALGGFSRVYWLLQHGADPKAGSLGEPVRYPVIEDIFWHPGNPRDPKWQRLCQQWLLQRGYQRPPMPKHYREMRQNLGFPSEENRIPLS